MIAKRRLKTWDRLGDHSLIMLCLATEFQITHTLELESSSDLELYVKPVLST